MSNELAALFQPIGDRALALSCDLESVAHRVRAIWSRHRRTIEELSATAPVQRLRCIGQLNEKRSVAGMPERAERLELAVSTRPIARITRYDHSRAVSARALAFACASGANDREAVTAAVAGLLHDVGHPPFSHTLEHAIRRFAPFHHEHAGMAAVRGSDEIRAILERADIDLEAVLSLVEERGGAGMRQSVADTVTYLWHDALAAELPVSPTLDNALLASLVGCDEAHLYVRGAGVFNHLLTRRAKQYVRFYQHPFNRLLMLLIVELATAAHEAGALNLLELQNKRDEDLWRGLRAFVSDGPSWARSAMRIIAGDERNLADWEISHADCVPPNADAFASQPIDYTRKELSVVLPDGTRATLRAPPGLRPPHHAQWLVAHYIGAP